MECKPRVIANVVLLQVEGRIDHTTAKAFESALLPHLSGCTGKRKSCCWIAVDWSTSAAPAWVYS